MADYTPTVPEYSVETQLQTYEDAVQWVIAKLDRKSTNERDMMLARGAVQSAYRELATRHQWKWYRRTLHIDLSATYSTGTITYDHTGGTYERELTLASGTWPSDAAYGIVKIGDKYYTADDRKSSTVLTLREDNNPGADVAAGTSYRWQRESYPLPPDFWKARTPVDSERGTAGGDAECCDIDDLYQLNRAYALTPGTDVLQYAFGSDRRRSAVSLFVAPMLSSARTLAIPYQSFGRPLSIYRYSTGTVSVSADEATVTGSGTTFTQSMVGSVIRISDSTTAPTGPEGTTSVYNPAAVTGLIKSVASATSLEMDHDSDQAISGKSFVISDPVDIDPQVMTNAFRAMADYHFVRSETGLKGRQTGFLQSLERELLLAKAADGRSSVHIPSPLFIGGTYGFYDYTVQPLG